MAVRKLPPSLFSVKARSPQSGCSKPHLHFIAHCANEQPRYALVRESQSTVTRRDRVYLRPKCRPECPAQAF
jgi:hypothetical protein